VPGLGECRDDDREIVAAITVAEGTCIQGTDGDSPDSMSLGVYSRSKHQGDAVSQRGGSLTSQLLKNKTMVVEKGTIYFGKGLQFPGVQMCGWHK
jgi:hypothetical protein